MASPKRFKAGVTIHPQRCTIHELRDAWRRADELGVDSVWFWDHFYPLHGDPDGNQFECWSLLAATVNVRTARDVKEWLDAGLQHFVLRLAKPFDTKALERVLKESRLGATPRTAPQRVRQGGAGGRAALRLQLRACAARASH